MHGTVSCTKPTQVTVGGTVTQVVKRTVVRGSFSTAVACAPGAPTPWTGSAVPGGTTPFQKGDAQVDAQATGYDADYGGNVTTRLTAVVTLRKR